MVLRSASTVRADAASPAAMLEQVRSARPPVRDLVDLSQRIQSGAPAPVLDAGDAFWINDLVNHSFSLVPVDLRLSSGHFPR